MLKDGARASVRESGSAPSSPLVGHQSDDEDGTLSSLSLPVTASTSQQPSSNTQPPAHGPRVSLSVTSTHSEIVSSIPSVIPLVSPSSLPVPSSSAASMATAMQGLSLSPELANSDDFDQAVRMLASASKDLDGVSSDRVSPLSSHPSSSFASRPTPTVVHAFVSPSSSVVSSLPSSTPLSLASTSPANSGSSSPRNFNVQD